MDLKTKLVPPDGGWGYAIAVSTAIINIATQSFMSCFGMIFHELIVNLNLSTSAITSINALNVLFTSLSGFLAGPLLKATSQRKLLFIAAIIYNAGNFLLIFTESTITFVLCQMTQAIGLGLFFNISTTVLNEYFHEKRLLMLTITNILSAVTGMLAPLFVSWTNNNFGYKGTLLIISGVYLHTFLSAVLLQPVSWHMKRIPVEFEDATLLKELKNINKSDEEGKTEKDSKHKVTDEIAKTESTIEMGVKEIKADDIKCNKTLAKFKNLMDWNIFKNLVLLHACLGMSMVFFVDTTFTLILPQALYHDNWDQLSVAWALTVFGLGDITMRVILILFNKILLKYGYRKLYMVGIVLIIFSRFGFLLSTNRTIMLIYIFIIGITHCMVILLISMVITEMVDMKDFASAIGLMMLLMGVFNVIASPIVGAVRDLTKSYRTIDYIMISLLAIVLMFWSIELCYMSRKDRILEPVTKISKRKPKTKKNRSYAK